MQRVCCRFGITLAFCKTPDSSLTGPAGQQPERRDPFTRICKTELGGINTQQGTDSSCTCPGWKYHATSFTPGLSKTSCFWPGHRDSSLKLLAGPPWRVQASKYQTVLLNPWEMKKPQHLLRTQETRPKSLKEHQLWSQTDKATRLTTTELYSFRSPTEDLINYF